jgi:CRISPR-associated protein Csm1
MKNNSTYMLQLAALLYDLVPWYAEAQGKQFSTQTCAEFAVEMLGRLENPLATVQANIPLLKQLLSGSAQDELGSILAQAQKLASTQEGFQTRQPLRPILEVLGKGESTVPQYGFVIQPLCLDERMFPAKNTKEQGNVLFQLWEDFEKEFLLLPTLSLSGLIDSLFYLIQKYAAFLPSTAIADGLVSIFDHAKTVAALAACLYAGANTSSDRPFLLIGGDLSGIQTFLYDIISKNASKLLKGRSFYLQLLIDSILEEILTTLQLSTLHVVYASGGGFFLIAPNIPEVVADLEKLQHRLAEKIFDVHQIQLTFSLATLPFGPADIAQEGIATVWEKLIQAGNAVKKKKFAVQIQKDKRFFEPCEIGGDQGRDVITNEEFGATEKPAIYGTGEKELKVKQSTHDQIVLGQRLRTARWWLRSAEKLRLPYEMRPFRPCDIGPWNYFLTEEELVKVGDQLKGCRLFRMNHIVFMTAQTTRAESLGFVFYGGNSFPADENGDPLTFEELVGVDREGEFKRLAILRMDVDNLGYQFAQGLKGRKPTFAHYACLSRSLDLFFKGWLNTLRESRDDFKQGSYIVYSGGDDLFIVGRWDLLFEMAGEIHAGFKKWSCYNPEMGLSGGLTLVGPKFPISRAATLAEEQEKRAKEHRVVDGSEKNAIALFGYPLNWEVEFPMVWGLKEEIVGQLAADNDIQQSLISKVKNHHAQFLQQGRTGEAESWRWNLAWDFARMVERENHYENTAEDFLKCLYKDIVTNSSSGKETGSYHHYISLANVAARWAELELRQNRE